MTRSRIRGLAYLSLILFLATGFPLPASADDAGEAAAAAQQQRAPTDYRPIRRLGGATRFTRPVNTVDALQKMFSQARIQSDVRAVSGDGQPRREHRGGQQDPQRRDGDGNDDRSGDDDRMDGVTPRRPAGHLTQRALGRRQAARRLHVRDRQPDRDVDVLRTEDLRQRLAPEARAEPRSGAARRRSAQGCSGEGGRRRRGAQGRGSSQGRRSAQGGGSAQGRSRPQSRRSAQGRRGRQGGGRSQGCGGSGEEGRRGSAGGGRRSTDAATVLRRVLWQAAAAVPTKTIRRRSGSPAGQHGYGVRRCTLRHQRVASKSAWPEISRLASCSRRRLASRSISRKPIARASLAISKSATRSRRGFSLGTGLTLWDFTHGDQFTFGWLGTAAFPVWKNEAKRHRLDASFEWRQFFDRMSDPDVNYQFWGGLRYMFK